MGMGMNAVFVAWMESCFVVMDAHHHIIQDA
jgi:hypothetical protein